MSANLERDHLIAWAERAQVLASAWRDASAALRGTERGLALEMAEEWSGGWPAEVLQEFGSASSLGPTSVTAKPKNADLASSAPPKVQPAWLGLALLAARYYDLGLELRRRAAAEPEEQQASCAALAARVLASEAPRAEEWARALGRLARGGDAALIAGARRAIDSSELWNLCLRAPVEGEGETD